jgi:hypothetical protein
MAAAIPRIIRYTDRDKRITADETVRSHRRGPLVLAVTASGPTDFVRRVPPVQHVGVEHRRGDVPMSKQFLNRPDVVVPRRREDPLPTPLVCGRSGACAAADARQQPPRPASEPEGAGPVAVPERYPPSSRTPGREGRQWHGRMACGTRSTSRRAVLRLPPTDPRTEPQSAIRYIRTLRPATP